MDDLIKVCRRVTDTVYQSSGMDLWQWGRGVALFALSEVFEKRKEEFCMDYIRKWTDDQLDREYPGRSINTTAPCLSVLELYKITGDERYLKVVEDFAQWCMACARRSDRGMYEHSCTENFYDNQVWADTLFMGCLFLARYRPCASTYFTMSF